MTDQDAPPPAAPTPDDVLALRDRADVLERQLSELQQQTHTRLVRAEMKAEALRAGMIDLDGLKLVDMSGLAVDANGEVVGAASLMTDLKRRKPWLFAAPSSSSAATPPPSQPPRPKLATEMTDDEYRAARAALLKHRG